MFLGQQETVRDNERLPNATRRSSHDQEYLANLAATTLRCMPYFLRKAQVFWTHHSV
jgi:hypothetical protein